MLETLNEITLLVDEPLKNVTFTKTGDPADVLALPKTKRSRRDCGVLPRTRAFMVVLSNASN